MTTTIKNSNSISNLLVAVFCLLFIGHILAFDNSNTGESDEAVVKFADNRRPCYYNKPKPIVLHQEQQQQQQQLSLNSNSKWEIDPHTGQLDIVEYCPDANVSNVTPECRNYWMAYTSQIQFTYASTGSNLHCPNSMLASIIVDHSDASPTNHFINGINCGSLVSKSSGSTTLTDAIFRSDYAIIDVIKITIDRFPSERKNALWWNKLSIYSITEPSVIGTSYISNLRIKEIIYSVGIDKLIEYGYPVVDVRAVDLLKLQVIKNNAPLVAQSLFEQASRQDSATTTGTGTGTMMSSIQNYQTRLNAYTSAITENIIGGVLEGRIKDFLSWQFRNKADCPAMCERYHVTQKNSKCMSS